MAISGKRPAARAAKTAMPRETGTASQSPRKTMGATILNNAAPRPAVPAPDGLAPRVGNEMACDGRPRPAQHGRSTALRGGFARRAVPVADATGSFPLSLRDHRLRRTTLNHTQFRCAGLMNDPADGLLPACPLERTPARKVSRRNSSAAPR